MFSKKQFFLFFCLIQKLQSSDTCELDQTPTVIFTTSYGQNRHPHHVYRYTERNDDGTERTVQFPSDSYRYGLLNAIDHALKRNQPDLHRQLIKTYCENHPEAPNLGYVAPYYANSDNQQKVNNQHNQAFEAYKK